MIEEIRITYCKLNDKYDLFVNENYCGKFYSIQEAIKGIDRAMKMIENDVHKRND